MTRITGVSQKLTPSALLIMASLVGVGNEAKAQNASPQPSGPAPIQFLRYDDDVSWYKDPKNRESFPDTLKYIPFLDSGYISLGGSAREIYENFTPQMFGLRAPNRNEWYAMRALVHADIQTGFGPRAFLQLGREEIAGKKGALNPNDESHLDVQQAFVDVPVSVGAGSVTARVGRQELFLGSGLLQSLAEGANIRTAFDAAHLKMKFGPFEGTAFYGHPVRQSPYSFQDAANLDVDHYGFYGTAQSVAPGLNVDGYIIGYDRKNNRFNQGTADESRRTVGTRLWGRSGSWDYSGDFVYQFGSFGSGNINAWASLVSAGYSFGDAPLTPRLSINALIASGDKDPKKASLNTFNPMFSLSPLLSESNIFVPMNLVSVYPKATIRPFKGMTVSAGANMMWRETTGDGFYTTPGILTVRNSASKSAYIGTTAELSTQWHANHYLSVIAAYTHFKAGDAMKDAGGKNFDYTRIGLLSHF